MRIVDYLLSVLFLSIGFAGLQAQEVISTTGGEILSSGGSVSYTVGQLVYNTNTGANGSVAQGIQQPYEISVVSGINSDILITLECTVYPNPVVECLMLKVVSENISLSPLYFQLYDTKGRMMQNKKLQSSETSIDMRNLVPATYFLKVTDNKEELKTFKIIKK